MTPPVDLRITDPHYAGEVLAEPDVPIVGVCVGVDDLPLAGVQALGAALGALVGHPQAVRDVGCRWVIVPPWATRPVRRRLTRAIARVLRRTAPRMAAA